MGAAASSGSDTTPADDLAASFESWVTSGGERCAAVPPADCPAEAGVGELQGEDEEQLAPEGAPCTALDAKTTRAALRTDA